MYLRFARPAGSKAAVGRASRCEGKDGEGRRGVCSPLWVNLVNFRHSMEYQEIALLSSALWTKPRFSVMLVLPEAKLPSDGHRGARGRTERDDEEPAPPVDKPRKLPDSMEFQEIAFLSAALWTKPRLCHARPSGSRAVVGRASWCEGWTEKRGRRNGTGRFVFRKSVTQETGGAV